MPVKVLCPNPDCNASHTADPASIGPETLCGKCGTPLSGIVEADTLMVKSYQAGVTNSDLKETFGRYRIVRKLGEGGMGAVYLGEDTQLHRQAAIKVPHLHHASDPASCERFLREARAAAAFRHPNFCPIYDVGEIEGRRYLAMAYIEGETLENQIRRDGPLQPREAAEIVRTLARAMAEAHQRGFIHRDLKPSNILVEPGGNLIITDFGLARRIELDNSPLTRIGTPMGTPAYMSPEQVDGDPARIGPATDIYALGVILYELLTAERPFRGGTTWILAQILTETPPPPSKHIPTLDPEIETICLKAMARSVADRYASMGEFAEALADYSVRRSRAGRGSKPGNGRGRGWKVAAVLAVGMAIVLPVVYFATLRTKPVGPVLTGIVAPLVPETETKPEPPKVFEKAQPKPEPPKVVEKVAPKPEPPKVVEKVAPKPEPPKVVEKVAPKPEPPKLVEKSAPKPDPPKVIEKTSGPSSKTKVVAKEPPVDLLAAPIKRMRDALAADNALDAYAAYVRLASISPRHPKLADWVEELDDFHELPFWWLDRAEERADLLGDHLNPYLKALVYLAVGQRCILVKDFGGAARVLRKASHTAASSSGDVAGYSRASFGEAYLPAEWSDSKAELLAVISLWQSLAHDSTEAKKTAAEASKARAKTSVESEKLLIEAAEALSQGGDEILKAPIAVQLRVINIMARAEAFEEASVLAHSMMEKLTAAGDHTLHPLSELVLAHERKRDYPAALRLIRLGHSSNSVHHVLLTYLNGDLNRALRIADGMVSEVARAEAQREIAVAQAENGDIEGALKTVEAMKTPTGIRGVRALVPIARAQCRQGKLKEARATLEKAASLALSRHKLLPTIGIVLDEIGAAFVKAKAPEEAERIAREIQALKGNAVIPVHTIGELAQAGLLERAERVALLGGKPLDLKRLLEIASGQVRAGDYSGARTTLARIKRDEPSESRIVISIALNQIRAGNFRGAEATLGTLTIATRRAAAYIKCAEQVADLKAEVSSN
jgi:serine/threonine protein kinase